MYLNKMLIRPCRWAKVSGYILLYSSTNTGCWLYQTQFCEQYQDQLWLVAIWSLCAIEKFDEKLRTSLWISSKRQTDGISKGKTQILSPRSGN